jgi:hypothetical protein
MGRPRDTVAVLTAEKPGKRGRPSGARHRVSARSANQMSRRDVRM